MLVYFTLRVQFLEQWYLYIEAYEYFNDADRADPMLSSTTAEAVENFPDGINSVTIGEKVSYLLKLDEIFSSPDRTINISRRNANNLCSSGYSTFYKNYRTCFVCVKNVIRITANGLLVFTQIGTRKMIEIMMLICPGIKDASSGVIINMDYKVYYRNSNFDIFDTNEIQ